ncbi:MAG: hypothetical protein UZ17_ACD001000150 [Acidobacteria bacterium OLB17]|nr:MAG: hypothetical protein UZ17_ACD001000150 [Acidobacteria bacterium OLB17]MCZ2391427.1 hypothetical protein [Acidobacteriota bacterium]
MAQTRAKEPAIKVHGKSWVIDLPDDFSTKNDLPKGTQVLLTFKGNDKVEAEVLPPLDPTLAKAAAKVLKRRRGAYDELKRLGD